MRERELRNAYLGLGWADHQYIPKNSSRHARSNLSTNGTCRVGKPIKLQGCGWIGPASSLVEDLGASRSSDVEIGEQGWGARQVLGGGRGRFLCCGIEPRLIKLRQSRDLFQRCQSSGTSGGLRIPLAARGLNRGGDNFCVPRACAIGEGRNFGDRFLRN
jgi:hypothetical protein